MASTKIEGMEQFVQQRTKGLATALSPLQEAMENVGLTANSLGELIDTLERRLNCFCRPRPPEQENPRELRPAENCEHVEQIRSLGVILNSHCRRLDRLLGDLEV